MADFLRGSVAVARSIPGARINLKLFNYFKHLY